MINGVFSSFESEMDLKDKFSRIFSFTHEVESEPVTGVIQLDAQEPESQIGENHILNCELIDYVQVGRNIRKKDENTGRYFIKTEYALVPRLFRFQIINKKYVRMYNSVERPIVIKALTIALGGNKNQTKPVNFDMKKIESDYPKHKKSNVKRSGLWQGGTIHGTDIAKDPLLSEEYPTMYKSSITFETRYFDKMNLSVSVSQYGGISFKVDDDDGLSDINFIDYFVNELTKYSISGKVVNVKRTSSEF